PNRSNFLYDVAVVNSNDIWAVGYVGLDGNGNGISQTLTEHWNGTAWSVVTSPNQGTGANELFSVAVVNSSDVWAVGGYYPGTGNYQTLTEHWTGSAWAVVSSPSQGSSDNYLSDVAVVNSSDVWTVGSAYGSSIATL